MNPVVITGRGLITPIGLGMAENLEALKTGKSGITRDPYWQELNLDSQVAGKVNLDEYECPAFDRKQLRFMPQSARMAVAAAYEAITEAGYTMQNLPGSKMAVITGCGGSSYSEYFNSIETYQRTHSVRRISPFSIPRIMPSSAVANLSLVYKIGGESYDVSCACTSGAVALIQAIRLIQSGAYDIVMAGGCEELCWQQAVGFGAMHALSHNFNEEPEKSSRPFDVQRTGFVLSEAAGIMILESEAHAKARGAKSYGRISGYGCNSNACDMVAPSPEVSADVMSAAIKSAGLTPADIDYVNTHGTGTPVGDPVEVDALKTVFHEHGASPMINSTKSQTGHPIGAAGAIELIFCSQMIEHSFVSPSINADTIEESMKWADIVRTPRMNVPIRHAISNSFGFGGTNAAIIVSRDDA
ncbi:MAG: beta-ketoacyl-[Lentisphaeria bacterium]|nr:beta-ketoacyl-[acyl-carrier-protein] synthase family protein [Lentisphaeria bacterium]